MPTIINPYKGTGDTLGESLSGLGEAFFGPKASQSALYREKFREQARINENLPLYAGAMAAGGDPGEIARLGILSGQAGQDVGNYGRYVTVNRGASNLNAPPVTASILGAGGAMSSTPMGHTQSLQKGYDLDLAKTDRLVQAAQIKDARERINVRDLLNPLGYKTITVGEFLDTNRKVPGSLQEVTSQDILKSSIAGSPQGYTGGFAGQNVRQGMYLGTEPATDKELNWIAPPLKSGDPPRRGRTVAGSNIDIGTNTPLPADAVLQNPSAASGTAGLTLPTAPGAPLTRDIQSAIRSADQTLVLGQQILEKVTADPTIVGLMGNVRRISQETADVVVNAAKAARIDLQARGATARAQALLPELFDENLNSIQTLNGLLVYRAAEAIGQTGRGASDKDIERVLSIVGRPDSWLQGPQTYQSKVRQLMAIIQGTRDDDVKILKGGDVTAGGNRTAPSAASVATPLASGTTSTGVPWTVEP